MVDVSSRDLRAHSHTPAVHDDEGPEPHLVALGHKVVLDLEQERCLDLDGVELASMRDRFASGTGSVDHAAEAPAFAATFLAANYLKVVEALRRCGLHGYRRIVDLGAGPGAAAAAALVLLAAEGSPAGPVDVVLVDRSPAQLTIAQQLLGRLAAEAWAPRVSVASRAGEIETVAAELPPEPDTLVLLSHVVTENPESRRALVDAALAAAGPRSTVLVVERADDDCLTLVYEECSMGNVELQYGSGEISWPSPGFRSRHRRLRWLALSLGSTGGRTASSPATSTCGAVT